MSEPVSVAKEWDDLPVEVKSLPSWVIAGYLSNESKFPLNPPLKTPTFVNLENVGVKSNSMGVQLHRKRTQPPPADNNHPSPHCGPSSSHQQRVRQSSLIKKSKTLFDSLNQSRLTYDNRRINAKMSNLEPILLRRKLTLIHY